MKVIIQVIKVFEIDIPDACGGGAEREASERWGDTRKVTIRVIAEFAARAPLFSDDYPSQSSAKMGLAYLSPEFRKELIMIACYCRCSTTRQKTDSQQAEIEKWLSAHGYDQSQVKWYIDHESGKTLKRPQFAKLQQDIFNGQIKTVICWKLDRLSRRLKDGVSLLADWCERGVKVIVITQMIELNGAVGRMIAAVLLGLAEIELEYRQERQLAGIQVAKKRGIYTGRERGTFKANPERAKELRSRGLKVEEIASALGTSKRTVLRYLKM